MNQLFGVYINFSKTSVYNYEREIYRDFQFENKIDTQMTFETFEDLIQTFKRGEITNRQLIMYSKKFEEDIINHTHFLDKYDQVSMEERLYYPAHNLNEAVLCKHCGHKATWTGRFKDGYRATCSSKECLFQEMSNVRTGKTNISENRDASFMKKQAAVTAVNDDLIKEMYTYDKFVDMTNNPIIIKYLENRYDDSKSLIETVQRIKRGIEHKPKCPTCGRPVNWIGKDTKLMTKYCCEACAANDPAVQQKKLDSFKSKMN